MRRKGRCFLRCLAAYGHWFGFALPILRTLTIVFAVLLAVSFAKLAEQLGHGASAISLICLPYFVILGTTAMTDVPCLALTVFAVYAFLAYTDSKSLFHLVVGVLASTAASYIRIDSLYVLVAIGAAFAVQNCLTRQLAIGLIAPFFLRAPLVFIWGEFGRSHRAGPADSGSSWRGSVPRSFQLGGYRPLLLAIRARLKEQFATLVVWRCSGDAGRGRALRFLDA